jgi:hypothetical protein
MINWGAMSITVSGAFDGNATIHVDIACGEDVENGYNTSADITVRCVFAYEAFDVTYDATGWQGKAGEGNYQALPLTGLKAGTAVTVKYSGTKEVKSIKAVKKVAYTQCPDDKHPHWIDLGLPSGTLWQCCNVGATAPEGYGEYINYNDALSNNPPTLAQIQELLDGNNTTSEWTTLNSVNGRWFTSKNNGGKVFLPAAGGRWDGVFDYAGYRGYYWSSTLYESDPDAAYYLYFASGIASWNNGDRGNGLTVRPVRQN